MIDRQLANTLNSKPAIEPHIEVTPVNSRGQPWWMLCNGFTGQHLRLNLNAWKIYSLIDGERSVADIARPGESGNASEVLALLERLNQFGALRGMASLPGGTGRDGNTPAIKPGAKPTGLLAGLSQGSFNPLSIRVPMFDPDAWLGGVCKHLAWLFNRSVLFLWLLSVVTMLVLVVSYRQEIQEQFRDVVSNPGYWLMLWLIYPLLKLVHETAHGLVIKRCGHEVHEAGITFLVFTPIPYVDASASWSIASKRMRLLVSAAGLMAELSLAFVALLVFLLVEPGALRTAAFLVFSVGAISSVLFNANPLLKFDGYYVLQDYLELPNLYQRARLYLMYLGKRYLLSVRGADSPVYVADEKRWLFGYGVASLIYRYGIVVVIALWLLEVLPLFGVLMSLWLLYGAVFKPLVSFARYLSSSEDFADRRVPVTVSLLVVAVVALAVLMVVPVAHTTRAQGIVWVPEQAEVFTGVDGEVVEVNVEAGQPVQAGDVLLVMQNLQLETEHRKLQASRKIAEQRIWAAKSGDQAAHVLAENDLIGIKRSISDLQRKLKSLTVVAATDGVFYTGSTARLQGRYFEQGDHVGYLVDSSSLIARVVIPEHRIAALESDILSATVRLAERFEHPVAVQISRLLPGADRQIPSLALADTAGGGIPIARSEEDEPVSRNPVFHLELSLPSDLSVTGLGERVYASLKHPAKPLATRMTDAVRRLILRRLPQYGV